MSWMKLQPKQLVGLIFDNLIPSQKLERLWELLEFLSDHIYSRLSSNHEPAIRCVELAVLQLYLVTAAAAGRTKEIQTFFTKHGDSLLCSPDAISWLPWFSLPYVREPGKSAQFKVCCSTYFCFRQDTFPGVKEAVIYVRDNHE